MNETDGIRTIRIARNFRAVHERVPPRLREKAGRGPTHQDATSAVEYRTRRDSPHFGASLAVWSRQLLRGLYGMLELSRRLAGNDAGSLSPRQVDYAQTLYSSASAMRQSVWQLSTRTAPGRSQPVQYAEPAAGQVDADVEALIRERSHNLIQVNAQLRQEIERRERTEQALQAARREAEAANAAKSEFLAHMSHEIRTPMNGILGMTELTLSSNLTSEQREYLDLAKTSAEALLVVIDDVLDFSRIEAGCMELERIPFSLHDCLVDSVKSLALSAERKGLELACEIDPKLPETLLGDPVRLRQVLINLAGNAIKFTERGHVVVQARVLARGEDEVVCRFSIDDSGIGIDKDRIETIFVPYRQADSTISRRYGGTGLGLGISARLVNLMSGRIWVESEPGTGSTFHFTARFRIGVDAAANAAKPIPGHPRVLVAEHKAGTRNGLTAWLRHWQVEVDEAGAAPAALAAIAEAGRAGWAYDLVLVADDLPGIDAAGLCSGPVPGAGKVARVGSILRQIDGPALPVLTRPVKPSDLRRLLEAGEMPPLAAANDGRAPAEPMAILVVEDNAVNRRLAEHLLARAGHRVSTAESGEAAIEHLRQGRFDLVLMDLEMPGMSGIEATAAIRALEAKSARRLPIVALSAHTRADYRERCLAADMDDYLVKPVRSEQLLAVVERIQGRGGEDKADESSGTAPIAHLDLDVLLERVGNDRGFLAEIILMFQSCGTPLVDSGREAMMAGDQAGYVHAMHTLVGMLSSLAAGKAAAIAARLETADCRTEAARLKAGFAELECAVAFLTAELVRISGELGTTG